MRGARRLGRPNGGLPRHFPALETLELRYNALSRTGTLAVKRALAGVEPRRFAPATDVPQLLALRAIE